MEVVMATMPVFDAYAIRTAVMEAVAAVMAAPMAAVAAEAEVYFDTSIGVGSADGGGACSNGERGSSSHKGFLQHDVSPIFSV